MRVIRLIAMKNGRTVEGEYIILNPLTNKEEVFLPREFIERRKGFAREADQPEPTIADLVEEFTSRPINKFTREVQRQKQLIKRVQNDALILKNFCKEKLPQMDFSSVGGLLQEIDFSATKYIELIAIVEKAVRQEDYSIENVKELFLKTPSSRMQLAIMELLPAFFKGTGDSLSAQELLKRVILDFAIVKSSNYKEYQGDADEAYTTYEIAYDEDWEYDTFITASIVKLAEFGQEAENSLLNIFQEKKIENRKDVEEDSDVNEDNNDNMDENYFYEGSDIDKDGDLIDWELKDSAEPFYLYNSTILNVLSKIGTEKSIAFAIDFIKNDEDSSFVYKEEVLAMLNGINVTQASGKLLELLRSKDNSVSKRAGKFLFSLEVGRIGISKEGVKYLEKMFDLKELNNPDFSAKRLTASGKIGIFDKNGTVQRYIQVDADDLLSDEKVIHPEILEFTTETLFFTKSDETAEEKERREKYLKEFKESFFDFYDENFYKDTGVRFNNLELQEQGQFLMYYKKSSPKEKEIITSFIKKYKENGLKTFLSIEQGGLEMGEKILTIGEKLDQRSADAIFAKYAELIELSSRLDKEVENYTSKTIISDDLQRVEQEIQKKAGGMLVDFANRIEEDNTGGYDMTSVIVDLEKYKADLITSLSFYSALKGNLDLEELKLVSREEIQMNEIINDNKIIAIIEKAFFEQYDDNSKFYIEDLDAIIENNSIDKKNIKTLIQILNIYKENWRKYPERGKRFIQDFFRKMKTGKSTLHIYKHQEETMSFMRVDSIDDENVYLASFNSVDTVKGNAIGSALQAYVVSNFKNKKNIKAKTILTKKVFPSYLRFGFIATEINSGSEGEGNVVKIEIPKSISSEEFKYKKYTSQDIIEAYKDKDNGSQGKIQFIERYKLRDDQTMYKKLDILFRKGYVCTRAIFDKKTDFGYFAIEKISESE